MVRLIDLPQYRDVKNVNPFSSGNQDSVEHAKIHFSKNFTSAAVLKADDGVNWTTETQTEEQKKEAEKTQRRRELVGDGTQQVCTLLLDLTCRYNHHVFIVFLCLAFITDSLRPASEEQRKMAGGVRREYQIDLRSSKGVG